MGNELSILALYGLVIACTVLAQVLAAIPQVGLAALATARDDLGPLTGRAGRLERALKNSIVSMALFAPAVLLLNATAGFTLATLLAAQIFLVARIVYVFVYAAGIPWLRTIIWTTAFFATIYLYLMAL